MRKKLLVILLLLVVLIVLVVTRCGGKNRTIQRTARALRSRAARRSCPRS